MNLSHRTSMVLAAGLLLLSTLGLASARPAEDKVTEEAADALKLAVDERAGKKLQAAADYLQEEDWENALRLLQFLLDSETDALARLAGRAGKPDRYVSIHAEAERLLAALPQAGRTAYQRTYGPRAADALEAARESRSAEPLARIVQRYLYTDAGPVALRELARLHYKADRLHLAALSYARLLEHLGPARWTNDDLYQASAAFHQRSTSAYADVGVRQLLARSARNVVRLGERSLTVQELRKEIDRATASAVRQPLDWPVYRGDAARTNHGAGTVPFLKATWRKSLLHGEERAEGAQRILRQAEKQLHEHGEPIVPAFSPLAITMRKGTLKTPIILYRNHYGFTAIDARNGRLLWISPSSWSLQRMLQSETQRQNALNRWLGNYVDMGQYPQILFENSTIGTVSTDGEYVYFVEDFAVPPPSGNLPRNILPESRDQETEDAIYHNYLYALDLSRTGALSWTLGEDANGPLSDCYFLAPPLPLDGLLYVLVEKQQQIYLLCVDVHNRDKILRRRPRIVFLKPLVRVGTTLAEDPIRRIQAAHLAYSDGILVCPTNAGVVLGVDLLSNRVAWVYPYPEQGKQPRFDRFGRPRAAAAAARSAPMTPNHTHWKTTAPIIADGKVVLAPPDDPSLYCLNLIDGSLAWSRPKQDDDLYLGGVYQGKVLIVGAKSVRGLNLASGQTLWTVETGLPSGQGIASDGRYYLPLQKGIQSKQPEICVLDVSKGQTITHDKTPPRTEGGDDFDVPGNLMFVEGRLISQTAWEIAGYPPLKAKDLEPLTK